MRLDFIKFAPMSDVVDQSMAESAFWHGQAHMPSVRGSELVIAKGEGSYVWTEGGERLFDATASLWYCNIGHGRREVVDAVTAQMRELEAYHTFANFSNRPAEQLTRRLQQMAPIADARIFLSSGGSDSVDAAAKLARRYWAHQGAPGRHIVVSRRSAYHGLHAFGTSLSGMEPLRADYGGELVADTALVETNDADSLAELISEVGAGRREVGIRLSDNAVGGTELNQKLCHRRIQRDNPLRRLGQRDLAVTIGDGNLLGRRRRRIRRGVSACGQYCSGGNGRAHQRGSTYRGFQDTASFVCRSGGANESRGRPVNG